MLMEQILSRENLNVAYLGVKANEGAPGVDGMRVTELKEHVRKHWATLEGKLKAGTYQPAAVRAVEIPKASGGKYTLKEESAGSSTSISKRSLTKSITTN